MKTNNNKNYQLTKN